MARWYYNTWHYKGKTKIKTNYTGNIKESNIHQYAEYTALCQVSNPSRAKPEGQRNKKKGERKDRETMRRKRRREKNSISI